VRYQLARHCSSHRSFPAIKPGSTVKLGTLPHEWKKMVSLTAVIGNIDPSRSAQES